MYHRAFKPLKPTDRQISARNLNRAIGYASARLDFGPGSGGSDGPAEQSVSAEPREGFEIKITSGSNPYAWTQVVRNDDAGSSQDYAETNNFGTTTECPAFERGGNTTVAANTIVWAEIDAGNNCLVFDYPSSSVNLTTQVTGTLGVTNGGTGSSTAPASGEVPIGNGAGAYAPGTLNSIGGTLGVSKGGTGTSSTPTNGQILIGNGSGYTLATITEGSQITIANAGGSITISVSNGGACSLLGRSANSSGARADISASTNKTFLGRKSDALGFSAIEVADINGIAPVLIASGSASNAASISITGLTGYRWYEILLDGIQAKNGGGSALRMRTSTNNGSSYDNGASDYVQGALGQDYIQVSGTVPDDSADGSSNIKIRCANLAGTSLAKIFFFEGATFDGSSDLEIEGRGVRDSTADIDAIQFLMATGNLNGTYRVYGYP